MNLIEQLGGYYNAKNEIKVYDILKTDHVQGIFKEDLINSLLQYRRNHNIFEVGDYFCYESKYLSDDPLDGGEYAKLHQLDSLDFECGFIKLVIKCGGVIRHATDEEIKTGRRF